MATQAGLTARSQSCGRRPRARPGNHSAVGPAPGQAGSPAAGHDGRGPCLRRHAMRPRTTIRRVRVHAVRDRHEHPEGLRRGGRAADRRGERPGDRGDRGLRQPLAREPGPAVPGRLGRPSWSTTTASCSTPPPCDSFSRERR
ncbi:hypothetical protein QJS66_11405 [Kocuria rhizophila]|nr:hypothetical protein QJS66_11405 [Kocuria rhizophila]